MVNVHLRVGKWVPCREYMGWTGLKNGPLNATMRSQNYLWDAVLLIAASELFCCWWDS